MNKEKYDAAVAEFDRIIEVPKSDVALSDISEEARKKAETLVKEILTYAYESGDSGKMETALLVRRHKDIIAQTLALKYQTELDNKEQEKIYNIIWAPRYHDKTVLLMSSKVVHEGDTHIEIRGGYYKGYYRIPAEVIAECRTEMKPSRAGNVNEFTVVPLDKLVKDPDAPSFDDEDFSKTIDEIFG